MALNIPMPELPGTSFLKGIDTGSSMFSRMMQPVIEREKQRQAEAQFQQQLAFDKQKFSHENALDSLRKQVLQQQLLGLQHGNDPNYEFQKFQALMNGMTGAGNQVSQPDNMGSSIPTSVFGNALPSPEFSVPKNTMGLNQDALSNFMPQSLNSMPNIPNQPVAQPNNANTSGINFDVLRQNPMLRGFFKHKFGFDPLEQVPQTPEEKQKAELALFKQKEAIKEANKSSDTATTKVLTQNQQVVQALDSVIPMLDDLISHPDTIYGQWDFSPSKKAAYDAKTGGMTDKLVVAQSLPQVKESIDLVKQQVRRQQGENNNAYIKRLKDFRKDLMSKRGMAAKTIKSKKVNTEDLPPLVEAEKVINGITYQLIEGEWHVK